jgi:GntR family transcriptional regulator/MocR family aminotransferase
MLLLPLDAPDVPLHRQIYQGVRERILDGRLKPGERLPSSRALAALLRVGRNTVLEAFDMLHAEGYLEARTGSGTFVTRSLPDAPPRRPPLRGREPEPPPELLLSAWARRALAESVALPAALSPDATRRANFRNGLLPDRPFPWRVWEKLARDRLAYPDPRDFQYGQPTGAESFRRAIADYVTRARGVRCTPEQVMVTSGSQGALDLISRVLLEPDQEVAVENPGYPGARRAFVAAGARLAPVGVDADGLRPELLPARARLLYLTPSHQYPTGGVLPVARRLATIDWARPAGAWILEDDYDSEYRYGGRPLAAMQGLGPERVIYCGTFSKALYPGFRLGFLVAPRELVEVLGDVRYAVDRQPPTLEQLIAADFLRDGHFERHLRRMRLVYAERRAALTTALKRYLPTWSWRDSGAGLHLYVRLPADTTEAEVIDRAAALGIGLHGASQYDLDPSSAPPALVLGYAHLEPERIADCIRLLGTALTPTTGGASSRGNRSGASTRTPTPSGRRRG